MRLPRLSRGSFRAGRQFMGGAGWRVNQDNTCFQFTTWAKTIWEQSYSTVLVNPSSVLVCHALLTNHTVSLTSLQPTYTPSSQLYFYSLDCKSSTKSLIVSLPLACKLHQKGFVSVHFLLYLQLRGQRKTHSRYFMHTCWANKWAFVNKDLLNRTIYFIWINRHVRNLEQFTTKT